MASENRSAPPESGRRLFVVDTDPGVDDAQAILMMLKADQRGEVQVLAVTTVRGNVPLAQVNKNAQYILATAARPDIPLHPGAHCCLVAGTETSLEHYHGQDGMGDASLPPASVHVPLQDEHAVQTLIRLARQHKGSLNILTLGPLTNLALAIRMDPQFVHNINMVYVMGGNHQGRGNTTPSVEFNFHSDPESAAILLDSVQRPVTIVTWETCCDHAIDLNWRSKLAADTTTGRFLDAIERPLLDRSDFDNWVTCDQLTAAVAIRTDIVTKQNDFHATVELRGQVTRGQMVVDKRAGRGQKPVNITLVEQINMDVYKLMLMDAFGHNDVQF